MVNILSPNVSKDQLAVDSFKCFSPVSTFPSLRNNDIIIFQALLQFRRDQ